MFKLKKATIKRTAPFLRRFNKNTTFTKSIQINRFENKQFYSVMQKAFILFLLFVSTVATINDNPGVSYSSYDEAYSSTTITLSDYPIVYFQNNTFDQVDIVLTNVTSPTFQMNVFTNGSLTTNQTTMLSFGNNTFTDESILLYGTQSLSFETNTINGDSYSKYNASECFPFRFLIECQYETGGDIIVNSNTMQLTDQTVPVGIIKSYNTNAFSSVQVINNTVSVNTTDPFTSIQVDWCQEAQSNNLTNGANASRTIFSLDIINTTVSGSFKVNSNKITVYGTNLTSKTLHSTTNYICDSLALLIGLPQSATSFDTSSNTIELVDDYIGLYAPIRVGLLFTGGTAAQIKTLFGITTTPSYQYIAKYISDLNPDLNPYTFKVQIEPNQADEFGGWDECHYACKHFCDSCIFTNSSIGEFSSYVDDVCFNRQLFDQIQKSTRLCRHDDLLLTGPFTNEYALLFASKNKATGILNLKLRSAELVTFAMNDDLVTDDQYKTTYDLTKSGDVDQSYFIGNHPFLIIMEETKDNNITIPTNENAVLKELTFNGIKFNLDTSDGNFYLFSTEMENPVQHVLDKFTIQNGIINANKPGGLFAIGYGLLRREHSGQSYTSSATEITRIEISDSTIYRVDKLTNIQTYIPELVLTNNNMSLMQNGLVLAYASNVTLVNNKCDDCYSDATTNTFVKLSGLNPVGSSLISTNQFTTTFSATSILTYKWFDVSNFTDITFTGSSTSTSLAIGLYFSNLGSYPCNYFSFVKLQSTNPDLNGVVFDFFCEPIGCKDNSCYDDESLSPEYCIVNKTYPITGENYNIIYFNIVQDAIDRCLPRIIYVVKDAYTENLSVHNKRASNESLIIRPLYTNDRYLIIGNNHGVTSTTTNGFNLTIIGMNMINPLGLTGYTTDRSNYMFVNLDSNTQSQTVTDMDIYSIQPLTPIGSLPSTYDDWVSLIDTLKSQGAVYPNIQTPNVYTQLAVKTIGISLYQNINLYGSEVAGLQDARISQAKTTIKYVYGENQWRYFIYPSAQWDLEMQHNNCTYFCGGLTSSIGSVYRVDFNGGTKFIEYNNTANIGPNPVNHPNITTRLPYGNPFFAFGSIPIGYVTSLWINDITLPANWVNLRIRDNKLQGYPIAVRKTNVDDAVLTLNDDVVLYDDARKPLRQIQYENDVISPTTSIYGTKYDIKSGPPEQDDLELASNFCNALCIPVQAQQLCTVDSTNPVSLYNFHSLQNAIASCPFELIILLDPTMYESMTTNFVYTTRSGTTLTIKTYAYTVIVGTHTFLQSCNPADLVPSSITFNGITFRTETSSSAIISTTPSVSTCVFPEIKFDHVTLTANSTFPGVTDGYTCVECNVINTTFTNVAFNGPFRSAIYIETTSSTPTNLTVSSTTVANAGKQAIEVYQINSISLASNSFTCNSDSTGNGCVYIYGIRTDGIILQANTINSNQNNNTLYYNAVTVYFVPAYNLSTVGYLMRNVITETTTATQYGLQIIVTGIDTYYPCNSTDDIFVNQISANNPNINGNRGKIIITDPSNVIISHVDNHDPGTSCFLFTPIIANTLIYVLIIGGIALIVFGMIFVAVFCKGWKILAMPDTTRYGPDPDLLARGQYRKLHQDIKI